MTQPNEHIREFLDYYIALPKPPEYAVLLTGLWGSGKTWFIRDFLRARAYPKGKVLYVSLYGLQTTDDIEEEFFRLLHPVLSSRPVRVVGKLTKGLLKTAINFDWDGDGRSDASVATGVPTEALLDKLSLSLDKVLIFDDVERCSISLVDLLGYINQFVEHSGLKVVLIANEDELLNQGQTVEASRTTYQRIKEKLIGRTFEVVPETATAIDHFAEELPSPAARELVRRHRKLVGQVYECAKFDNLRLVRHSLWDFDRLLGSLEPAALRSDVLLSDLLALFLSRSMEVRSGTIPASEVHKIRASLYASIAKGKSPDNPDQRFVDIRQKYSKLDLYESLVPDELWHSILAAGIVPAAELNTALLRSKHFQRENQPNWVQLWYGQNLPDAEFDAVLASVAADWHARAYENLGEVLHVAGLLIQYARHNMYLPSPSSIRDEAKLYIAWLFEQSTAELSHAGFRSPFDRDSFGGLGYSSLEDEFFSEILAYVDEAHSVALVASYPARAQELLGLLTTDLDLFCSRLVLNNGADNRYYKTPILHYIAPDRFVETLLQLPPEKRRNVAYVFKQRYGFEQMNVELQAELPWLRATADLLRGEAEKRTGKVSSLSIQRLISPYITGAIERLAKASSST